MITEISIEKKIKKRSRKDSGNLYNISNIPDLRKYRTDREKKITFKGLRGVVGGLNEDMARSKSKVIS